MARIFLTLLMIIALGMLFSQEAICAGDTGQKNIQTPAEKAGKGAKDVAFGWTEIPKQIVNKTKESGPVTGIFVGIFQGAYKAVARTASGVSELATFPVGGYDRPKVMPDIHSTK